MCSLKEMSSHHDIPVTNNNILSFEDPKKETLVNNVHLSYNLSND